MSNLHDQLTPYANQYVSVSVESWYDIDRIVLYVTQSEIVNVYFAEGSESYWVTFDNDKYDSLREALCDTIGNGDEVKIAYDIRDTGTVDYIDLKSDKWR